MTTLVTFGCRLNLWESEVMRGLAAAAGLDDAVIVNTCAVTAEAEKQARQAIRRARRERPDAPILVTGCAAQLRPERFAAMPEVTRVLGNAEKLDPAAWAGTERVAVGSLAALSELSPHLLDGFATNTRGFLQVQQGCDHRCTFCTIPLARGASRSLPLGAVVEAARRLVEAGHGELVLTGVDLTAWGRDLPGAPRLGQLVRRLLALVPELPRLRLSSVDPAEIDDDLWELIAEEPRLMPHVHLSIQAGDDVILKRMRRRHSRGQAIETARRIRDLRPEVALGADLIAGFPTEDEEAFGRSLDLVEEAGLVWLHVFPYSPRPDTPAARMPAVPGEIVRERARRLRAAGQAAADRYLRRQIGQRLEVLTERGGIGRSPAFAPVRPRGEHAPGRIVTVAVDGLEDGILTGVAA